MDEALVGYLFAATLALVCLAAAAVLALRQYGQPSTGPA